MARCGCSSTTIHPGCGIHQSGWGDPDDPYVIAVDACELAGDGLRAEPGCCKLSVAVAPNGGISVGPNGLYLTGHGTGGADDPSHPNVPGLLKNRVQCRNIVGAYLGGYLWKPQSTRACIKEATERGYDLLHLPVRFAQDGTPVISPDPMLGRQNGNQPQQQVQNQSPGAWKSLQNDAGGPDPGAGWFGYCEPTEQGLVTLTEALDLTQGRVPLVLELQWPITPDPQGKPAWTPGQEPPPQRVDQFLTQIKRIVQQHRAQDQVIVTSQWPRVPGAQPGSERDVFKELGLPHLGPTLYTPQDADRNAPGGTTGPTHNTPHRQEQHA